MILILNMLWGHYLMEVFGLVLVHPGSVLSNWLEGDESLPSQT